MRIIIGLLVDLVCQTVHNALTSMFEIYLYAVKARAGAEHTQDSERAFFSISTVVLKYIYKIEVYFFKLI